MVQRQNQFAPPFPGQPAPVIPILPDILSQLESAKAVAESRAISAKRFLGNSNPTMTREGQLKFEGAQAAIAALVGYLKAAAIRGFTHDDVATIETLRQAAATSLGEFVAWENALHGQGPVIVKSVVPLTDAFKELLEALLGQSTQRTEAARDAFIEQLQKCLLSRWDDLRLQP
jgi:hypothetical protein